MGLLTDWNSSNKVINASRIVTYTQRKLYGQNLQHNAGPYIDIYNTCWAYDRICKMSYEYVGMDLDTATECCNELNELYTRETKVSLWEANGASAEFSDVTGGTILMSDVSIQKMAGHMYKVVVNIHERDTKLRRQPVSSMSVLFAYENTRDYDEE